MNNTIDVLNMPTIHELTSAEYQIGAMAEEMKKWGQSTPEGMHMIVTMKVPDGRMMLVEQVKPLAHRTFVAVGYINELKCMVTGHISTLCLFCAYEEKRGAKQVGFKLDLSNELQQESQQKATNESKSALED